MQPRRGVSDDVAERILARILDGTFPVGQRLPAERELALELRVNRSSLREALRKLEQLRLVETRQGSGTRVQPAEHASLEVVSATLFAGGQPNLPWIRELLELRDALVPGMLRMAIERGSERELRECVEGLSRLADRELGDADFRSALSALPGLFAHATRNRVAQILANTIERFLAQSGFDPSALALVEGRRSLHAPVQRLAIALDARDLDTVERAARELMRRLTRRTLATLEQLAPPADHD